MDLSPISSFGVFANGSLSGEQVMADQEVSRSKAGYTYSPVKYFPDEGLDFVAYAPYWTSSLRFPAGTDLPVEFDFSLPAAIDEDVILAGPLREIGSDSAPVVLLFRHPLTRITVSFSISNQSIPIPSGKGIRATSVTLSHCIREGTFNAEEDIWSDKGGLVSATRNCRVTVSAESAVEVCSFYSVPFIAPDGASLHIEWEAFNLDSGAATRRYSADVDLSGRDFSMSQNITASLGAAWYQDTIEFEDPEAEAVCIKAFDTDGDGALSYVEAADVTDLGGIFRGNGRITLFNEFRYFTGVTHMGGYHIGTFASMSSLREITLPASLNDTDGWPFCNCPSLEKISVDESNPTFYSVDGCLYNRRTATLVRVPESVPIESFDIPPGILTVGYGCFESNMTITSLQIGKDVRTIRGEALKIFNLRWISVAPGSTTFKALRAILYSINEAGDPVSLVLIAPKGGLFSLALPETVTSIGGFSVFSNEDFREIVLNEGLESIGMYAFNGVDLGDLVIPSTVTYIGECALRYISLDSLTVLAANPPEMGNNALPTDSDPPEMFYPIYVPAVSYQLYLQAPVWGIYSPLRPFL